MKPASTEQRFKPAFELIHHVTSHQLNGENWNLLFYLSIQSHFADNKQMAIVSGPRQVGKTTLAQTMRQSSDWFMVEVKSTPKGRISPNLEVFRKQLSVENIFQVTMEGDYVEKDAFQIKQPVIVPAKTFLSQLP